MTLLDTLCRLDYKALPLSDYSRQYILRMLPVLDYYLLIYRRTLDRLFSALGREPSELTIVDYGGGHGFFSLAAKERGVGQVVYVDINPQAAEAVQAISHAVGFGPDVIITGDAAALRQWCADTGLCPDVLVGLDVVEHIYRLDEFFSDLFAVNPALPMILVTGSNPANPLVRWRLHRLMLEDELGNGEVEGFRSQRRRFIQQQFPEMSSIDLDMHARLTRGLTLQDIPFAIRHRAYRLPDDGYNTCDPITGSWTERLLPISTYRSLLQPCQATLSVSLGFYNPFRSGLKGVLARMVNPLLPRCGWMAPFIALEINLPSSAQ